MAAKEAIEDKVRQALMLKASTAYDPDLSHKTKSLNEAIDWPSRRLPIRGSSTHQSFHSEANPNNNKSLLSLTGWPPSEEHFQSRCPSPGPLFLRSFNLSQMSPPSINSNPNLFQF